jgi:hypothetical protein
MSGRGTGMLRLSSLDELAEVKARRERFQRGQIHTPEKEIQQAGLQLLKHHPRVAWCVRQNTGAGYVLDARKYHALVAAGYLKPSDARFMRFGFPGAGDATGQLIGGARLEVEFKSDRGVVTDEQQAVHEAVNAAGGLAIIARSVDDVLRALPT